MRLDFFLAYAITLGIEVPALFLFLKGKHDWKAIAASGIIASSLTLPFVWFFFPMMGRFIGLGWVGVTMISESFAFVAETVVYRKLFDGMGWRAAASISLVCNALSFLAGLVMH